MKPLQATGKGTKLLCNKRPLLSPRSIQGLNRWTKSKLQSTTPTTNLILSFEAEAVKEVHLTTTSLQPSQMCSSHRTAEYTGKWFIHRCFQPISTQARTPLCDVERMHFCWWHAMVPEQKNGPSSVWLLPGTFCSFLWDHRSLPKTKTCPKNKL